MYARSHCFTRIANDAVDRLMTRLANQRMFTRIAVTDGWKEEEPTEGGGVGSIRCPPEIALPAVWLAIKRKTVRVSPAVSG